MTATGPTLRSVTRSARGPVLVVAGVVAVALLVSLVALTATTRRTGELDPRAYDPGGAHALAVLLGARGTAVTVITTVEQVRPGDTIVVPFPERLTTAELGRLSPSPLLVVGADSAALTALGDPVQAHGNSPDEVRAPACDLPAASRAGSARIGGPGYQPTHAAGTVGCYASGGRAGLLVLPVTGKGARHVLLGSGGLLTNDHLDEQGDAALALGLLADTPTVQWLLPRVARAGAGSDHRTLRQLLPLGVKDGLLELLAAVVLLALWRARRLGRVVVEPLPVVVRAAESVEGRSRLYRAARARDRAAESLRGATRGRAVHRLTLGGAATRGGLLQAASARTGRGAADLELLLYGPAPGDDAALVRLADDLRTFTASLDEEPGL